MAKLIPALFLALSLLAAESPESTKQLTLLIYDYSEIQPRVLRQAQRETQRIFDQLGIRTIWLRCPISADQLASNRACSGKFGANHLYVKLLPRSMSKKYGFKKRVFGFALPAAYGARGTHISLFVARVLDLAYYGAVGTSFEDAQALILGHMIAHEVGHLQLGPNSHSPSGLMSFPWNETTLMNMERGRLRFSARQGARIHMEMARRSDPARELASVAPR